MNKNNFQKANIHSSDSMCTSNQQVQVTYMYAIN